MKNKFLTSFGVLLLVFTSYNALNNVRPSNTVINAEESYKIVFKQNYRERNFAMSSAGWWGNVNDNSFANETATIKTGGAAYFANGQITAGNTYVISYDLKTEGDTYFQFNVNTPEWKNLQGETLINNSDFVHYDFIYTPTVSGDATYYFMVTGGSTIYLKNLYIYDTTYISVNNGEEIGELPAINPVEGKKGYWSIDGKKITNQTIYNYTSDKIATLSYEDSYSITYYNGGAYDLASDTKYWNTGTNLVKEDDALHMLNEDGLADVPIHTYDASDVNSTTLTAGKKYQLSFDIKCDNLFLRIANCSPWVMLYEGWTNYASFTNVRLNFEASDSSTATFRFRVDTTGNVFIKNLRVYEVSTIECNKNEAITNVPEIKKQGKYNEGVWQIDNQDINKDTIFDYDSYNKEAYVKYFEKYTLTYYGSEDNYTENLAKNISYWTKQGNANLSKFYENNSLVFTGEANAMARYCDSENLKLIENETYVISGKIKTGESKIHLVVNNDWTNNILLAHYQALDYQTINLKFTASKNQGDASFIDFQFASANGDKRVEIQDLYITHIKEESYTLNSTLSNLPKAPTNSGWVIDNTLLTNETKYNFSEDKIAYLAPIVSYNGNDTITYRIGRKLVVEGLDVKSFYSGSSTYQYTWYDNENNKINEPTSAGSYKLGVKAIDANGTISLNEALINVNVLEKDVIAPTWVRDGNTYTYSDELNITVKKGWYAQLNIEALDDIDGVVAVEYDYNGLVDEFNRFVLGSGDVKCIAKDLTGNTIQIIIHLTVVE